MQTPGPAGIHHLLQALEREEELLLIDDRVDPRGEMSLIAAREQKSPGGGKALLFRRVAGSPLPVALNLFGSPRRISLALGAGHQELRRRVGALAQEPGRFAPRPAAPPRLAAWGGGFGSLPAIVCHEGDGRPHTDGSSFTLAVTLTRDPEAGSINAGIYRVVRFPDGTLGIGWRGGGGAASHHRRWQALRQPMPVAVILSPPPELLLAAAVPLPPDLDEMTLAGALRGTPLGTFPGPETGLPIPRESGIVIEGVVDPTERRPAGSFFNHTGTRVDTGELPVVTVRGVWASPDPVVTQTVPLVPPSESTAIACAAWGALLPLVQRQFPEIAALHLPPETVWHGAAIVALHPTDEKGNDLLHRLWRSPFFRGARLLILVDGECPVDDPSRVLWQLMNRVVWGRDLVIAEPGDPAGLWGGRIGVDGRGRPLNDPSGSG